MSTPSAEGPASDPAYTQFIRNVGLLYAQLQPSVEGLVIEIPGVGGDPPLMFIRKGVKPNWREILYAYYPYWKKLHQGVTIEGYPTVHPIDDIEHLFMTVEDVDICYWVLVSPAHPRLRHEPSTFSSRPGSTALPPPSSALLPPPPPSATTAVVDCRQPPSNVVKPPPPSTALAQGAGILQYTLLDAVGSTEIRSDFVARRAATGELVSYDKYQDSIPALGVEAAPLLLPSSNVFLSFKGHVARVVMDVDGKVSCNSTVCRSLTTLHKVVKDDKVGNLYTVFLEHDKIQQCRDKVQQCMDKVQQCGDKAIQGLYGDFTEMIKLYVIAPMQKTGFIPRDFAHARNDCKPLRKKYSETKHDGSQLILDISGYASFNCSALQENKKNPPCTSYIKVAISSSKVPPVQGPDKKMYSPVYVALQQCSVIGEKRTKSSTISEEVGNEDRQTEHGPSQGASQASVASSGRDSKRKRPCAPYLPVTALLCGTATHDKAVGRWSSKQVTSLAEYAARSAGGMNTRSAAPLGISMASNGCLSPGSGNAMNNQLKTNVGQARRATSAAKVAGVGKSSGNHQLDIINYANASKDSLPDVVALLPYQSPPPHTLLANITKKVHKVTTSPLSFHILSPEMMLAAKMAADITKMCCLDFTGGFMGPVANEIVNALVLAVPFPKQLKIAPAYLQLTFVNQMDHAHVSTALEFMRDTWLKVWGDCPFYSFLCDMAPAIASAVMEVFNKMSPMQYAMLAELLRFKKWSELSVIKWLGPTVLHDTFHTVRAISQWVQGQNWSSDKKKRMMSLFMVRLWQRIRDSADILDIYQVVIFLVGALSTKEFPCPASHRGATATVVEVPVDHSLLPPRIVLRTGLVEGEDMQPPTEIHSSYNKQATEQVKGALKLRAAVIMEIDRDVQAVDDEIKKGRRKKDLLDETDKAKLAKDSGSNVVSGGGGGGGGSTERRQILTEQELEASVDAARTVPAASADTRSERQRTIPGTHLKYGMGPAHFTGSETMVKFAGGGDSCILLRELKSRDGVAAGYKRILVKIFTALPSDVDMNGGFSVTVDVPEGATTAPNPFHQDDIDVITYLRRQYLSYLAFSTKIMREGTVVTNDSAGTIEGGANSRLKSQALQNLVDQPALDVLTRLCGAVGSLELGTSVAFRELIAAACTSPAALENVKSQRGWLDADAVDKQIKFKNQNVLIPSFNQLVHKQRQESADEAPDGRLEADHWNRSGLSQHDEAEFVGKLKTALAKLEGVYGKRSTGLGTWGGQVSVDGHLRSLLTSLKGGVIAGNSKPGGHNFSAEKLKSWCSKSATSRTDSKNAIPQLQDKAVVRLIVLAYAETIITASGLLKRMADFVERCRLQLSIYFRDHKEAIAADATSLSFNNFPDAAADGQIMPPLVGTMAEDEMMATQEASEGTASDVLVNTTGITPMVDEFIISSGSNGK